MSSPAKNRSVPPDSRQPHTSVAIKTAVGSLIAFVLILATGVLSYLQSVKQLEASHAIARTHEVLTAVERVSSMLGSAESGLYGYVLCGNERLLAPYRETRSEIMNELNRLQVLTANNERHQARIAELRTRILGGLKTAERTVALQTKGDFHAARDLIETGDGCILTRDVAQMIAAMESDENQLLAERTRHFAESSREAHLILLLLLAGAAVMLVLMVIFIATYTKERKRTEEALRHLATIVESSDDAILSITPDGTIISWNPAAERLYGYSPQEIIGQSAVTLVPPDRRHELDHVVEKLRSGQRLEHYETTRLRKDGTTFDVSLTISPMLSPNKELTSICSVVRDVTEQKRLSNKLARRTQELARSNADLELFAYAASHDLQEPLRAIGGYLDLLAKQYTNNLDGKAQTYIENARDGATRMTALIRGLLDYARIDTGKRVFQPTDCEKVVGDALANLKVSIEESGAEIVRTRFPTVMADSVQLTQVIQNLVGNAIKFRRQDVAPRIEIRAQENPGELIISVQDNGIGFDMEHKDRVFTMFRRLHTRSAYPGTGIGLTVCKKIIERHGGKIWAESQPGHGTTFSFTLPAMDGQSSRQES